MIKHIKSLIFGERVQGEPVRPPLDPKYECVTCKPKEEVGYSEWCSMFQVSVLYVD